jgi:hypothetical protein
MTFKHALDATLHERAARFDRSLDAEAILHRYREPLSGAAYDLQSRLYNILKLDFFSKFALEGHSRNEDAIRTTLFRIAQYFGWTEILRREIVFLSFPDEEEETTRRVAGLQAQIAQAFLTDRYGSALMIWADEQRALGERMIVEEHGKVLCMGYARFRDRCDDVFGDWRERVELELRDPQALRRLRILQHLLCELVETLDERNVRYSKMKRA